MEAVQKIGKFSLLDKIGQGGMADVYLAEANYNGLRKTVALKRILQALSANAHFRDTFRYEAELSMELNHPNVVQVFEYGQASPQESDANGCLYMVMEFVDGVDLMKLIRKSAELEKPLPLGLAAYIISEVLRGLDYAHRLTGPDGRPLELVHRDMSPQNILLSREGAVKVTDFGIAKALGRYEEEGILRGKLHYMSPEQARTEAVDCRSDIFAVGLILYEMVSGTHPYSAFKGHKALEAARRAEITPPSLLNARIPVELEQILRRALAPRKEDRYQRGKDMQADLSRFLHSLPELTDATTLLDAVQERFPEAQSLRNLSRAGTGTMAAVSREGKLPGTLETDTGRIGQEGHLTLDTHTLVVKFKESKSLVSMVVRVLNVEAAAQKLGAERVNQLLDQFGAMIQNILLKDKQNRYRNRREDQSTFLVVRGIPYTGEYDESELLRDAHKIRRDFAVYREVAPELELAVCVYRLAVELEHDHHLIHWTVNPVELQEALRWAQMIPGEIVVSPYIYAAAKYNWEMESVGSDPENPVHRLVRQKDRDERLQSRVGTALIGRGFELDRLRDLFHHVRESSRPEHLVVLGEMGVGKSALLQEFIRTSKVKLEIIRAESRPYLQYAPFAFIMDFVRDFAKLNVEAKGEDSLLKLYTALTHVVPDEENREAILKAFRPILDSRPDEGDAHPNLGILVTRALEILLAGVAQKRPVLAVFEDMQWADEQSKRILQELRERNRIRGPVLFLFTGRERTDIPAYFLATRPIVLQNMDEETSRKFVSSRFLAPDQVKPLIEAVIGKGEGNPFYLNEMIASLVDTGQCRLEGPERKLALNRALPPELDVKLFPTLEGILSARLDALSPGLRRILRIAAVLGRKFSKSSLDAACSEDTAEALDAFVKKQLLRPPDTDGRHSFVQSMMRDYAYSSLPQEERSIAHRIQAESMIASDGYKPAIDDVMIARHLELSGQPEKAAEFYLAAAHHARKLGTNSNSEAIRHYEKVLELVPEQKEMVFHAHRDRETILRSQGRREEQAAEIQAMQQLAIDEKNAEWLADTLCREMAYLQETGESQKVNDLFPRAFEAAQAVENPSYQVDALRVLARAKVEMGELDKSLELLHNALSLLDEHPQIERIRADVMHVMGNALFYRGRAEEAMTTYEEALQLYRKYQRHTQESTILMNLGFISAMRGYYEKALEYYKASYDIDREKGDRVYTGMKLANLAQAHIDLGNYEQARQLVKQARKLCEQTRDKSALADAYFTSALLRLRLDRHDDSLRYIDEGLRLAREADSRLDEIRGLLLWAECQLENPNGSAHEAAAKAMEAARLAQEAETPAEMVHAFSLQARALLKLGNAEEAIGRSAHAVAFTVVQPVPGVEVVYYVHGKIMQTLGRTGWARMFLSKARDEIMRKANLLSQDKVREVYLSVYPARDILRDYLRFIQN